LKIIADTSFVMIPGMFGVDIFSELDRLFGRPPELLIPSPVVRELKKISKQGKPKERMAARLGLLLIKHGSVIETEGSADESILKLAVAKKCFVGTSDAALRKELRNCGVNVIYLRGKSHLATNGQIR